MNQGGLCYLLVTIMTLCAANHVSGPETEMDKNDNLLLETQLLGKQHQHTEYLRSGKENNFIVTSK